MKPAMTVSVWALILPFSMRRTTPRGQKREHQQPAKGWERFEVNLKLLRYRLWLTLSL